MAEFHLMKFHTHMEFHTLQSTPYGEADVCDSFSGGYTTKPMPATVISYNDASRGTTTTFVKRASTEAWLLVATTGSTKAAGSPFGRTTVLGRLREQLRPFYDKPLAPITTEDSQACNPMDAILEGAASSPRVTTPQGQRRGRRHTTHPQNTVLTVRMPARCPEEDPKCTELREVRLYVKDRDTIFLHIDDVEWAVRYLFVQSELKGVPVVDEDSTGPCHPRSGIADAQPAVAGTH